MFRSPTRYDSPLYSSSSSSSSSISTSIIENLPLHILPILEYSECDTESSSDSGTSTFSQGLPSWAQSSPSLSLLPELQTQTKRVIFTARKRNKSSFSYGVLAFCVLGFAFYYSARSSLKTALTDTRELVEYSQRLGLQLRIAHKDVRLLERELAALDDMEVPPQHQQQHQQQLLDSSKHASSSSSIANPQLMREMVTIQRSLKKSHYQAEHLKEQVKEISKRDAIAKYGAGVQRVELELIFPNDQHHHLHNEKQQQGPTTFVIEMAPIHVMPHSVYTFLEMTSAGLLDGCSFILNALHVLKAAPLPYDGSSPSDKAQEFLDKGLESVAFREYSPDYPHDRYTVGFAADGSPSFYINTEDNTDIHVGDPCFAKVISGFDTIQRMEKSPTRNGIWLEQRIGIKRATVL
jgi:cyclophilin family peptidyl-prolyl cis-trans isomerase